MDIEGLNTRIDDLKETTNQRFDSLEQSIKTTNESIIAISNCKNCKNEKLFLEKFRNRDIHIGALWTVISAFFYKLLS